MNGRSLSIINRIICHHTENSESAIEAVESWTNENGVEFVEVPISEHVTEDHFVRKEETLGVTLGGDGAFLEGVKEFSPYEIPMLGVNTGTLAFLARVSPSDIKNALDEIIQGRSEVVSRQRVSIETDSLNAQGVNEVMIKPVPPENPVDRKIASVDIYLDGEYVGDYTGSGLAISTPTGSTGISLSAEGPIHYPSNNLSLQIVPLHTHKMGVRPVILSSESKVIAIPKDDVRVQVDGGRYQTVVEDGEKISLTGAENRAKIVRTSNDEEFFTSLTEKLGWGLRDTNDNGSYNINFDEESEEDIYEKAKNIAIESAKSAGSSLREIHGDVDNVEYKSDKSDMVTEADYKSQRIIKSALTNEFPDHTVLSEEDWNKNNEDNKYEWIIDPLDGTGNFMHGNPNYSISLALLEDGEPVVAVVYQPETDEVFYAIKDKGAYADDHKITTSETNTLDESMLISGYDPNGEFIETFYDETQGIRAIGSAALNLCYIASGAADCSWEYDTYPWDVVGGLLILKEAGGMATDYKGDEYEIELNKDVKTSLLSTNGKIHDEVLDKIQNNIKDEDSD